MMDPAVFKLKSFQSKTDQVVEKITELILTGNLENESSLPPENEMCGQLGVSRSIFRESMKILAAKGLVEIRQGIGTIVKAPNEDVPIEALSNFIQLNQVSPFHIMEVRAPLEIEIARLSALRRTEKHLTLMGTHLDRMNTHQTDFEICIQADHDFHKAIVASSENPLFVILTRSIEKFFTYLQKVTIKFGVEKVVREHSAILEAIRSQDPEAAALAMKSHMDATVEDLKRL